MTIRVPLNLRLRDRMGRLPVSLIQSSGQRFDHGVALPTQRRAGPKPKHRNTRHGKAGGKSLSNRGRKHVIERRSRAS